MEKYENLTSNPWEPGDLTIIGKKLGQNTIKDWDADSLSGNYPLLTQHH
jgi:hypothetical protein